MMVVDKKVELAEKEAADCSSLDDESQSPGFGWIQWNLLMNKGGFFRQGFIFLL